MYNGTHVSINICMCVHMYVYIYMYVYIHIYIYIYICIQCMCVDTSMFVCRYMWVPQTQLRESEQYVAELASGSCFYFWTSLSEPRFLQKLEV